MTEKEKYQNGANALDAMKEILYEKLWLEQSYSFTLEVDIDEIRKEYVKARDAAIAYGVDTSNFPRKINWNTNHRLVA